MLVGILVFPSTKNLGRPSINQLYSLDQQPSPFGLGTVNYITYAFKIVYNS